MTCPSCLCCLGWCQTHFWLLWRYVTCFLCVVFSTGMSCFLPVVGALHFALVWGGRAERHLLPRPVARFNLVCLMALIDIIIVRSVYARLYWYVPHRRIASAISATLRALWCTLLRPRA
jgi:hypothetical protein